MKKVIVVGGAGFIGSNLVDALLENAYEVHVVDNLIGGKKENVNKDAKLHILDIRNLASIKNIFNNTEYVFHLAALPRVQFSIENPVETNDVNVNGTLNVLIASRDAGVKKVVYSASSSAYGNQEQMPLTEDMPANPLSPYGLQKYIGEMYCKVFSDIYGLKTVSLRYFNVYGPRLNPDGAYALVIGKFLKQMANNEPLTVTGGGTQTRDFTHVLDVVRANILAAESKKIGNGEVINIGAGRNFSINKLAGLFGGQIKYIESRTEPKDTLANNQKAKDLLGWTPKITLEEGIEKLKKDFGLI